MKDAKRNVVHGQQHDDTLIGSMKLEHITPPLRERPVEARDVLGNSKLRRQLEQRRAGLAGVMFLFCCI
jgi:hypothetical protein